ncbi:hypothetical protein WR25_23852 [Diploscapter pachys]|uniref:Phospholipase B-like n=1 Tax=Diploscapter pachys TaxID=2018661 RepID=A0A2A2J4G2_9BILA|nr:hypothetical protein WR25_23852 [Diploscapter pachys]
MSNNFTKDPLSRCNCNPPYSGENAIACRSELNPKNGTYPFGSLGFRDHGATDAKVTNSHLINSLQFTAVAGPTHDPTPVFDWNTAPFDGTVPHFGQPTRWTWALLISLKQKFVVI